MTTPVVGTGATKSTGDAEWYAFQGKNPSAITTMRCGNVFFGITMSFTVRFDLTAPIPKGSTITSASMDLVSNSLRTGAQSMEISSVLREGLATPAAWERNPDYTNWRQGFWESVQCRLIDTGASQFFESHALASNQGWVLRLFGEKHEAMAEMITLSGAGSPTLGSATMRLLRVNNPAGNIWLELYSVKTEDGITMPDALLATSDTRLCSSISTTENNEVFTFSGGDQIVMPDGAYALVVRADYPFTIFDQIQVRNRSAFFFGGTFRKLGKGIAYDDGNYPGRVDVLFGSPASPTSVLWAMPATAVGVTYTTPDLTAVIQEAIDDDDYVAGDPIALRCAALGATGLRIFRTWDFDAGVSAPVLNIEYTLPPAKTDCTHVVEREDRNDTIKQEDRSDVIALDDRSARVRKESRSVTVLSESRNHKVKK